MDQQQLEGAPPPEIGAQVRNTETAGTPRARREEDPSASQRGEDGFTPHYDSFMRIVRR